MGFFAPQFRSKITPHLPSQLDSTPEVCGDDGMVPSHITELNSRLAELSGLERAPIVLVCRTDKRSAAAAGTLRAAGFSQINVLRRGMERWNESGLPVVEMRS